MIGKAWITAALLAAAPGLASAQTATSKLGKDRLDQAPPSPRARQAAPPKAPAARRPAPGIRPFVLREILVEGSTASPEVIRAAVSGYVGKTVDGAMLNAIVNALVQAYAGTDIALYTVVAPDQDFAGGLLKLTVIEGHLESATIGEGPGATLAAAHARRMIAERPLKRSTLERYVSLMRDIPGLNPQIQLVPGSQQGAVRLDAPSQPRAVQGGLAVNNRGTAFLGKTQVQGDLILNSAIRPGDQTRLSIALPTDIERFQLYSLLHSTPLGSNGTYATLSGSHIRTRPETIDLKGKANQLGLQVSHPLLRSYDSNVYLAVGVDGLNSANALLGQSLSSDRIRALRISASYTRSTAKSAFQLSGTVSQGLDALGARVASPLSTDQDFRKLNLRAGYQRSVAEQWVVRLAGTAQLTSDLLPSSEQIALGGEDFGRGYEAVFVVGDTGYAGSAELAWRGLVKQGRFAGSELYGFADAGRVRYKSRFGQPGYHLDIASAGGGARVAIASKALVQFEAARGLENPFIGLDRKRWRGIVSVRTIF